MVRWQVPLNGHQGRLWSAHGRVYAADDFGVRAFDAETGALVWDAAGRPASTQTGARAVHIFSARALFALDSATGELLWQQEFTAEQYPVVSVLCSSSDQPSSSRPPSLEACRAIETGDGVLLVSFGETVVALDADTGAVLWGRIAPGIGGIHLFEETGSIFAGTRHPIALAALDHRTGEPVWHRKDVFPVNTTGGGFLLHCGPPPDLIETRVDTVTGADLHTWNAPGVDRFNVLAVRSTQVFFLSKQGIWRVSPGAAPTLTPLPSCLPAGEMSACFTPDALISGDVHRGLHAVDLDTGRLLWHSPVPTRGGRPIAYSGLKLTTGGGAVFAAVWDGRVTAFESDTGRVRWEQPPPHPDNDGRIPLTTVHNGMLFVAAWASLTAVEIDSPRYR